MREDIDSRSQELTQFLIKALRPSYSIAKTVKNNTSIDLLVITEKPKGPIIPRFNCTNKPQNLVICTHTKRLSEKAKYRLQQKKQYDLQVKLNEHIYEGFTCNVFYGDGEMFKRPAGPTRIKLTALEQIVLESQENTNILVYYEPPKEEMQAALTIYRVDPVPKEIHTKSGATARNIRSIRTAEKLYTFTPGERIEFTEVPDSGIVLMHPEVTRSKHSRIMMTRQNPAEYGQIRRN